MARSTPGDRGLIGHAGQTETSIQLHLQPDLVDPGDRELTAGPTCEPMASQPDGRDDLCASAAVAGGADRRLWRRPTRGGGIGERIDHLAAERLADVVRALPVPRQ